MYSEGVLVGRDVVGVAGAGMREGGEGLGGGCRVVSELGFDDVDVSKGGERWRQADDALGGLAV